MTTNGSQTATKPRHWSDERADAAVQAAIDARALAWAAARALGLADDQVERLPQAVAEMRAQLIEVTRRDAASTTQLVQVHAILAGVLAAHDIDPGDDPVRLATQTRALVRSLEADLATVWREMGEDDETIIALSKALRGILSEADGNFDHDVMVAAARDALREDK